MIEKPQWNLTIFKAHFGLLTLKGYTKGERVLRFEAIVHNTKQLGCGRTLDKFAQITRAAGRGCRRRKPVSTQSSMLVNRSTSGGHPRRSPEPGSAVST